MSKLSIIIKNEYMTDIKAKSFWISTFAMPVIMIVFGGLIGYLASSSDSLSAVSNPVSSSESDLTGWQIAGMTVGILLTVFIMIYGAQIFNKVKTEKCNRIMEILATCVSGRTMMLAKIVSVGLVGLTQIVIWMLLACAVAIVIFVMTGSNIDFGFLADPHVYASVIWGIAFFSAGYVFYASMFAAIGAMTDKNQENQEYVSVLTFILLGSFYIGEFAVDNASSQLVMWCSFIPFTSATVGSVGAIGGTLPFWQSALSLVILVASALVMLSFSGKLYTSTLLLKGKRLSPKDIVTFIKSK